MWKRCSSGYVIGGTSTSPSARNETNPLYEATHYASVRSIEISRAEGECNGGLPVSVDESAGENPIKPNTGHSQQELADSHAKPAGGNVRHSRIWNRTAKASMGNSVKRTTR